MYFIYKNIALLDKVVINNVKIIGFTNFKQLQKMGNVEVVEGNKINYITADGHEFKRLSIVDEVIDKLCAGSKLIGNDRIDYCNIALSIKSDKGNLECYTVAEYKDYLRQIEEHLYCMYGIETDFSRAKLKEVEINRTFPLDYNFEDYHRVIELIMNNLPKTLKNQMDYKKVQNGLADYQTYYATSKKSNKSKKFIELKIYNKTKSIEKLIVLTDTYMRVEFKIIGADKIERALDKKFFDELTDQLINDYFDGQVKKLIVKPYENWKKARDKQIVKLMKEQREKDLRHWQTNVLRILQDKEIMDKKAILLDVEELMELVDKLKLEAKRENEIKKNLKKQAKKYETAFCNNDHLKMAEILKKLQSVNDKLAVNSNPSIIGTLKTA